MELIKIKKDPIFLHLSWLNYVHNYKANKNKNVKILTENHNLYNCVFIVDLPNVEMYATRKLVWEDFDIDNLKPYFTDKRDGAFIIKGNKISNKQILDRVVVACQRKLKISTEGIISRYLPNDYFCVGQTCLDPKKEIGSRSLFSITAALLGDESTAVYKLGQTVYGCSVGKLSKFTINGLSIDSAFERYSVTKFRIPNDFNFYTYKEGAKISLHYDVLTVKFYHYSEANRRVKILGEFLIKPKELDDYYNNKDTNLKFYKKHEIIKPRKGVRKLSTVFEMVGLDRIK